MTAGGEMDGPIGDVSVRAPEAEQETSRPARGPLRPDHLRTVRARQSRRLSSHMFRACDALFITIVTAIALLRVAPQSLLQTPVAQVAPFVAGGLLLGHLLRATGAYRFDRSQGLAHHLSQVVLIAAAVGCATALLMPFLDADDPATDWAWTWTLVATIGVAVLHTTWWILVRRWRSQGWLTPNIVLVGATARAEQLINEAIARRDINVLGVFDDRLSRSPLAVLGVPLLGNTEALVTHRITPHVDLIVVTVDPTATTRVRQITSRLAVLPNAVTLMVEQDEENARVAAVAHLADAPLAPLGRTATPEHKAFAKRIQDLVVGIPMLIVFSPVLLIAAIAIKLDSPGPVFFRQRRHGFNNEEIMVRKFRTMRHEAADAKAERQVTAGDDRVTRVGRFLRKSSIDELPQLLNVIRGEMSLVGPRPHAVGMKTGDIESAQLVAEYAHRHRIKPGITGWAAIHGSRGPLHLPAEVKRRVALDVEYIERQTFWLDLKIMVLTLPSFIGDSDAIR